VLDQLERLAALGITAAPMPGGRLAVAARDGFAALVAIDNGRLTRAGATGIPTSTGIAVLTWREGKAWFVSKGSGQPASEEQVASLRAFAADLESALDSGPTAT